MHAGAIVLPGSWTAESLATLDLIRHCFDTWPIRKIYFETHSANLEQFRSAIGKIFDIEAAIPEHQYFDGQLVDKVVLATYRTHDEASVMELLGRFEAADN